MVLSVGWMSWWSSRGCYIDAFRIGQALEEGFSLQKLCFASLLSNLTLARIECMFWCWLMICYAYDMHIWFFWVFVHGRLLKYYDRKCETFCFDVYINNLEVFANKLLYNEVNLQILFIKLSGYIHDFSIIATMRDLMISYAESLATIRKANLTKVDSFHNLTL